MSDEEVLCTSAQSDSQTYSSTERRQSVTWSYSYDTNHRVYNG